MNTAFALLTVAVLLGAAIALQYLRGGASHSVPWPFAALHGLIGIGGLCCLVLALRGPPRGLEQGTASFGIIAAAQASGHVTSSIPAHVAARMIFGVLDELTLAWVLAKAPFGGGSAGARPKKFDIVRAADWVITLVTTGLEDKKESQ